VPSEYTLDLCFIREHKEAPFHSEIERELQRLFAGRGTWYTDFREESGLDIAVAEVKGIASWTNEDEVVAYLEDGMLTDAAEASQCWDHLHGLQVKVSPKLDVGCCRIKK
jgi:hypothetical protein